MPFIVNRNEGWNAGARSRKVCSGDCQLRFSSPDTNAGLCIGFNNTDSSASFREITHAFLLQRGAGIGNIFIYESGVRKYVGGQYVSTDVFTIRRNGTVVTYLKNDVLLYTSVVPSSGPIVVDTSLYAGGDSV